MAEHLLKLDLLGVHEEGVRDVHRTKFGTLTAVDTRVCDVCEADHLEHEVRRDNSRANQVRLLGGTLNTVADRTCFDTRVALDTLAGCTHNLLESLLTLAEFCELLFLSFLTHVDHGLLDLCANLETLCFRSCGLDNACVYCCVKDCGTLLGANFNKGCLACLLTEDTPVSACEVALARNLGLTALAVLSAAKAFFLELVDLDTLGLVCTVLIGVLDDELSLVNLLLEDRVRVDTILFLNHAACLHRRDRTTAVQTNHDNVVHVDLVTLCKLVHCFCVTALAGNCDLDFLCTAEVLLDELREKQSTAVEGSCALVKFCRVGNECRYRVVYIDTLLDG